MKDDITIVDSNVTFGNNSPIIINSNDIQWDKLQHECLNLLSKLPEELINTYELKVLVEKIYRKDENGIKAYMKTHFKILSTNIICSMLSQYFINFLNKF